LQNPAVNRIAEIGRSFAPVEPGPDDFTAASTFVLHERGTTYVAAFNYGDTARRLSVDLARLGLPGAVYDVTELWTDTEGRAVDRLKATVPAEDAMIFALTR
jgi:alpha-galactosidase